MFIEVLYADLSRQKVALDDIDQLPKSNVLFILVTCDKEEGKLANIAFKSGFDFYALGRKRSAGHDWIMLFGWDDDDFVWRKTLHPHDPGGRVPVIAPLGCMHVVFE